MLNGCADGQSDARIPYTVDVIDIGLRDEFNYFNFILLQTGNICPWQYHNRDEQASCNGHRGAE